MGTLNRPAGENPGFANIRKNVPISGQASFHNRVIVSNGNTARTREFSIFSGATRKITNCDDVDIAVWVSMVGAGDRPLIHTGCKAVTVRAEASAKLIRESKSDLIGLKQTFFFGIDQQR